MSPTVLLVIYCAGIVLASLLGGWVPLVVRLTHKRMELLVSFVSGVMLGVALLNLLPHALLEQARSAGQVDQRAVAAVVLWLLAGFLLMFFVERFFCFHHHDAPRGPGDDHTPGHATHGHELTWAGAAIGLTVHSLIAGVALAASVAAAVEGHSAWAGLGTFLAIVLHKPFDSLTLGTLMAFGGRSAAARHVVNIAFGLVVPLGVVLFAVGLRVEGRAASALMTPALAISAGTFLCISLSDLLPELQFHRHDRGKLSAALLLGTAVAWGAARLESGAHASPVEDLSSSLDAAVPMDILTPPCDSTRPSSRSALPRPGEGRPRSVYRTQLHQSASLSAGRHVRCCAES